MRRTGRRRDLLISGGFLVLVGGLILIGWLGREPEATRAGAEPVIALARGEPAPALELPSVAGGTVSLQGLEGKVVMVNLWATWCPPCVREMPSIQRVYDAYGGAGLEVLAVAVDDRPGVRTEDGRIEGLVSSFVDKLGLTFPVVVDPTGDTERRFGTEYLPTTILIDRTGRIRATEVGGRMWDEEPYIGMVESLLEEE